MPVGTLRQITRGIIGGVIAFVAAIVMFIMFVGPFYIALHFILKYW
jgi:hypothetical protein